MGIPISLYNGTRITLEINAGEALQPIGSSIRAPLSGNAAGECGTNNFCGFFDSWDTWKEYDCVTLVTRAGTSSRGSRSEVAFSARSRRRTNDA